jgi:hypothetical protein
MLKSTGKNIALADDSVPVVSFKFASEQAGETLPAIAIDEFKWKAKTRLNINVGPMSAQKLIVHEGNIAWDEITLSYGNSSTAVLTDISFKLDATAKSTTGEWLADIIDTTGEETVKALVFE